MTRKYKYIPCDKCDNQIKVQTLEASHLRIMLQAVGDYLNSRTSLRDRSQEIKSLKNLTQVYDMLNEV